MICPRWGGKEARADLVLWLVRTAVDRLPFRRALARRDPVVCGPLHPLRSPCWSFRRLHHWPGPTRAKVWSTIRVFQWMAFGGLCFYVALMVHSSRITAEGARKKGAGPLRHRHGGAGLGFGRATGRYFAKSISNFTLLIGYIMTGLQRIGRPCMT